MNKQTAAVECQYCHSQNTYVAGHSPLCVETQHTCRECQKDTWHDDRNKVSA